MFDKLKKKLGLIGWKEKKKLMNRSPYLEVGLKSKSVFANLYEYPNKKTKSKVLEGVSKARSNAFTRCGKRDSWLEQHKRKAKAYLERIKQINPAKYEQIRAGYNYRDIE